MARRNANANQIIRKDGNNCFVEVLRNSFEIDRVLMKFVTYDQSREAGSKFTNEIDIYLTFEQFFRLCYDILDSQMLIKAIMADKQKAAQESTASGRKVYPKQRVIAQGGTSAESLAQKGKSRPDGMSVSRVLKIFAGDKLPIIFQAEQGPGETDSKGLIVPRYGYNPEQKVMMGLSTEDAKELFLMVREEVRAYLTARRVRDMLNPQTENNTPNYQNNQQRNQPAAQPQQRPQYNQPSTSAAPPVQKPQTSAAPANIPPVAPVNLEEDDPFGFSSDMFGGEDGFFG